MELFASVWQMLLEFAVLAAIVWLIRWLTFRINGRVQNRAKDWPVAQGRVQHARPAMVGEGRAAYWVGEPAYSYSVDGEYYAGTVQLPASSEDNAYMVIESWKDRAVSVRYLAGNPSRSVFILDEQGNTAALK